MQTGNGLTAIVAFPKGCFEGPEVEMVLANEGA